MVRSARAPLDYDLVFFNETGSTLDTENYLGYRTLQSYNVSQCAEECDSKANCTSFNIYFERDPSLNPDKDAGCANPASLTNIKCSWWASTISVSTANNTGETRVGFQIAVTGSNGKTSPPSLPSTIRLSSGFLFSKANALSRLCKIHYSIHASWIHFTCSLGKLYLRCQLTAAYDRSRRLLFWRNESLLLRLRL